MNIRYEDIPAEMQERCSPTPMENITRMAKESMPITVTIPGLRVKSEANGREHWGSKARRVKKQRETVAAWLIGVPKPAGRLTVTFTRVYSGRMKAFDTDDNLNVSLKACRDAVAAWMGRDDGDGTVKWEYRQERGEVVRVVIEIQEC